MSIEYFGKFTDQVSPDAVQRLLDRMSQLTGFEVVNIEYPDNKNVNQIFLRAVELEHNPEWPAHLRIVLKREGCYLAFSGVPGVLETSTIQMIETLLKQSGYPCVIEELKD